MLQRLLDRHGVGLTLHYVAGGLAPRPYTRAVVAVPKRAAQLDSAILHPWPEARLVAGWRPGRRHGVQASVLLVVGADGPCPREVLRAHRWQPWPVPTTLLRRWACAAIPLACPLTWQRHAAPTLLLPAAPALAHPAASTRS